ncbi:PREDICTED: two-component response regulator ORR3-like [Nelumbo nucifera]|uniref:Two-component response regulator ORR3-like n=1 Tax=Nelumbo nucifera TaxID=4432 RepID=A0A1U8BBY9_NELNU|nr:PREDICTED: two-component response regulator ORR3-like [Nelumbo nucifera]
MDMSGSKASTSSPRRGLSGDTRESERLHVLAVDDSSIDRKLIEKLLKSSSYRVTTVESGKRALELLGLGKENSFFKEQKVNMIITDYCMPEMTGFDLLKRVKESSALKEIPVVILSSENVPTRINRCLEEGAEEFLLKPLRQSDVSRLHNHMTRVNRCGSVS